MLDTLSTAFWMKKIGTGLTADPEITENPLPRSGR